MLYIVRKDLPQIKWHVGDPIGANIAQDVIEIQADGHELEHIKNTFFDIEYQGNPTYTIPMPRNKRVVNWFGSTAKTILANL
jgi:hypothetical protein